MGLKDRIVGAAKVAAEVAAKKAEVDAKVEARRFAPEFAGDGSECAVLGRETPSQPWGPQHFLHMTLRKSVAWRSAHYITKQQREVLSTPKFECLVLLYDDYQRGEYRKRVMPPKDFDFRELKLAPKPVVSTIVTPPVAFGPVRKGVPVKKVTVAVVGKPVRKGVLV